MSEEKFVKNWKMTIFTVKLFSAWEGVRGFSRKGSNAQGLVIEQWDFALLLCGCHHSSEDSKGVSGPCEAFPALHLSPLMEVSPAKQGGPLEP